jgi:hypothetical protein
VEPTVRAHVAVTAQGITSLFGNFGKLPADLQDKLTRAADRFALSQCRHRTIDRILDLAIAFEILTGGGKGDNAPAGWKVSVRTAQIIGGTFERRQSIREALSTLYGARSAGSHGGSNSEKERADQEALLADCSAIYRELVDSVLELGMAPDWRSLELEPRKRE